MSNSWKAKALTLLTAWALLVMPLSAASALAQATTGTLRGTVTDINGAAIAGAKVTVVNEATGVTTPPLTTSAEGNFDAPALPPGLYTVTVEAPGFKRSVSMGTNVNVGVVNPVALVLEAGNVAETVTVTAATEEVVQRDQAQISTTIEARRIQDLPSNGAGGGIDTLALLAPGVIPNRSGGTNTNGTGLSVNGNRGRSNNFQIDGADNNDLSIGGPSLFVDFQDSVQEFQVITNNFSAQYGRNQGAVVNVVTKGGTNEYHGTAFWFHQNNKALNSLNNLEKRSGQTEPDPSLYNVFGGTFGGPLHLPRFGEGGPSILSGKDRLFFFGSYQGTRNPATSTASTTNLAILASEFPRLQSAFPGNALIATYVQYSPFAIAGASPSSFASGTPTTQTFSQCSGQQTFLAGGPYDVVNLGGQCFQAAQIERTVSQAFTQDFYSFRFDAKPTDRDNVTFRYLNQKYATANGVGTITIGFLGDLPGGSLNYGGSWTRTLTNTMVNEFRASYQKIGLEFGGGCDASTAGCIPGPSQIGEALTRIDFSGSLGLTKSNVLQSIGPGTGFPQGRTGKVYQVADNLSWTIGRHSMIMGVEFKHLSNSNPFLPVYNGNFVYNSATRIINNTPSSIGVTGGDPLLAYTEDDQYYFFQDDFKIRPNLTLNLGVRYEYTGQPINALNEQSLARENDPARRFYNPALPLDVRTVPAIAADKNNIAPRVGFAYSPRFWKTFLGEEATVIRGGYSIAYDPAFYNILLNVQNTAPFSASLNVAPSLLTSLTTSPLPLPANPIGSVVREAANASGALPLGQLDPRFLSQTRVASDFRSPYSMQFSMGVQRQFGRRHVGEVRYVGTRGIGLFQTVNDNFFIGPLVNGFTLNRTAGGSIQNVTAAGCPAGTLNVSCFQFPAFTSLLPQGTTAAVCTDDPATALVNESVCTGRLRPNLVGINTRANTSQSTYHSMQTRYNGRLMNDALTLGLAYTWSKTIDDSSEIFAQSDVLSPNAQNPFCINRCERGLSALDRPHAFSMSMIYDVPWMREQRGFLGRVLGGWQVNSVYLLTSGATYTPGQASNATFGLGNTYLTSGDRPFLANPNADRRQVGISQVDAFFLNRFNAAKLAELQASNPGGFVSLTTLNSTGEVVPVSLNDVKYVFNGPGAARIFGTPFGSAGRNIERGPILNQLNLGLFKNIKVVERLTVQLRGEAFNVLNHPNPGFGAAVTSTALGYIPTNNINLAGNPGNAFGENDDISYARRVVQVGLRIIF
jgi:outer membrane receptor protein involved in Fe transport